MAGVSCKSVSPYSQRGAAATHTNRHSKPRRYTVCSLRSLLLQGSRQLQANASTPHRAVVWSIETFSQLRSCLPGPTDRFGNRRALAIHQHADTINARRSIHDHEHSAEANQERQRDLPQWRRLRYDAHEHRNGRGKRKNRHPECQRRIRTTTHRQKQIKTHREDKNNRNRQLPAFLRSRDHRSDERIECCVDEVTEQEEECEEKIV